MSVINDKLYFYFCLNVVPFDIACNKIYLFKNTIGVFALLLYYCIIVFLHYYCIIHKLVIKKLKYFNIKLKYFMYASSDWFST